jgi:hypothetical protein
MDEEGGPLETGEGVVGEGPSIGVDDMAAGLQAAIGKRK